MLTKKSAISKTTAFAILSCVLSTAVMTGCGGDSPTKPSGTPTPGATPVPSTTTVLVQPTITGLRPGFGDFLDFTVPSTGTLDADFSWTFASNDVDIYLTTQSCPSVAALTTPGGCTILASDQTLQKPAHFSFTVTQAGGARFWVVNFGSSNESGSGTVRLTR
jgi:hypothetical protein